MSMRKAGRGSSSRRGCPSDVRRGEKGIQGRRQAGRGEGGDQARGVRTSSAAARRCREPHGPGECAWRKKPWGRNIARGRAVVPRSRAVGPDGGDGQPGDGPGRRRPEVPGEPPGGQGLDRPPRNPQGEDQGEPHGGGVGRSVGGALSPPDGVRGGRQGGGFRAEGGPGPGRGDQVIGKGKVVVLLLAAVAAGVILSAGLNLSPPRHRLLGGGEKEKGSEVGAVAPDRVLPIESIPALPKGVSPAVVTISTTQVVRITRPRMGSPFGQQD